jgi:hypothetical protein
MALGFAALLACACATPNDPPASQAAAPAESASTGAAAECGTRSPCPLQSLMKVRIGPAAKRGDFEDVADGVALLQDVASAEFPRWNELVRETVAAACSGDAERVKQACAGCHDEVRKAYKERMRDRPLPSSVAQRGRACDEAGRTAGADRRHRQEEPS